MSWPLPPEIAWPRFLRLLRDPNPPKGWLEAAADLPDLRKRPLLLRWIAQHPKAPAHLRVNLVPRLPWRALAAVAQDSAAHPHAKTLAVERLHLLWPGLTLGERRTFALLSPKPLWPLIWRVPDEAVVSALLQNPRMSPASLVALVQAPLGRSQLQALSVSMWRESTVLAVQVLQVMDATLRHPEPALVLGHATVWIRALEPEEAIVCAATLQHPPLRRLVRAWADQGFGTPFDGLDEEGRPLEL